MSDIVSELRAEGRQYRSDHEAKLALSAAAEIERLRYELETMRRDLIGLADKAARARTNAQTDEELRRINHYNGNGINT